MAQTSLHPPPPAPDERATQHPGAPSIAADMGPRPLATREIEAFAGDPNFMTSLARGLAVMRGFSQDPRQLSIAQLSQRTGIPRAAVRRVLYTLSRLGYVGSEDGRHYALQPRLMSLGHAHLSSTPLVAAAQPFLDRVSEAVDESCSLAALEDQDILYLARSVTSRIISITLNIGSRLPAYCTSIGQVLLAELPPAALEAYLRVVHITRFTDHTPRDVAALRSLIARVREEGHALAVEQMEIGVMSVAVPIRDITGRAVAGVNVIAQTGRGMPADLVKRCVPPLQAAAASLSAQLLP